MMGAGDDQRLDRLCALARLKADDAERIFTAARAALDAHDARLATLRQSLRAPAGEPPTDGASLTAAAALANATRRRIEALTAARAPLEESELEARAAFARALAAKQNIESEAAKAAREAARRRDARQ